MGIEQEEGRTISQPFWHAIGIPTDSRPRRKSELRLDAWQRPRQGREQVCFDIFQRQRLLILILVRRPSIQAT